MICDKKAYESYTEAKAAIRLFKKCQNSKSKIPKRAYYCKKCGMYHVTSKKANKKRKLKDRYQSEFECIKKKNNNDKWLLIR